MTTFLIYAAGLLVSFIVLVVVAFVCVFVCEIMSENDNRNDRMSTNPELLSDILLIIIVASLAFWLI